LQRHQHIALMVSNMWSLLVEEPNLAHRRAINMLLLHCHRNVKPSVIIKKTRSPQRTSWFLSFYTIFLLPKLSKSLLTTQSHKYLSTEVHQLVNAEARNVQKTQLSLIYTLFLPFLRSKNALYIL
jgi:hypothetical protein